MSLGKHYLTCLRRAGAYFNETYRNYSLPEAHDGKDIFKVMGSKVKVTDNIYRKRTLPAEADRSTVRRRRPFSLCLYLKYLLLCYYYLLFFVPSVV